MPEDATPYDSEHSTRAAGRSFRVPVVRPGGNAGLCLVDDDGHAEHAFDWSAPGFVNFRDARLLADDSLHVLQSDGSDDVVLRLLPDRGGSDIVFRSYDGGIQPRTLLTGP